MVAPCDREPSDEEIIERAKFIEKYFKSVLIGCCLFCRQGRANAAIYMRKQHIAKRRARRRSSFSLLIIYFGFTQTKFAVRLIRYAHAARSYLRKRS